MDETLADVLAGLADGRAVEVGIGNRTAVARALAERGIAVIATDIVERETPPRVRFVRDNIFTPDQSVYADAGLVYALNCPPELQSSLVEIARAVGATWAFTTLGGDPAVVPARPRTLPDETLFIPPASNSEI